MVIRRAARRGGYTSDWFLSDHEAAVSRKAPPGTQSVLRAVRLLKALTHADGDLDLAELTAEVGLARTTTHRLLSALESEGLVGRTAATGAYRLGPAAIALGTRAMRSNDLRDVVRPFLEALASETGETATLEVPADGRMLILDEALGRHLVGAQPSLGTAWAIHATSSGKALLAALDGEERDVLISGRLASFTDHTLTRRSELLDELERCREQGWAATREELELGFDAVAAVIRNALGKPTGAISLNVPTARSSNRRIRELGRRVATSAADISALLSGRPAAPATDR